MGNLMKIPLGGKAELQLIKQWERVPWTSDNGQIIWTADKNYDLLIAIGNCRGVNHRVVVCYFDFSGTIGGATKIYGSPNNLQHYNAAPSGHMTNLQMYANVPKGTKLMASCNDANTYYLYGVEKGIKMGGVINRLLSFVNPTRKWGVCCG